MSEFEQWYNDLTEYFYLSSDALNAAKDGWNEALEQAKQAALSVEPAHIEREINKLRVGK